MLDDDMFAEMQAEARVAAWRSSKVFCVVVAGMAVFVDSLSFTVVIPILPIYKAEFDLSITQVGFLVGIYAAFQLGGTLLWGYVIDRLNNTKIILLFGKK
jgi:MFS family permease